VREWSHDGTCHASDPDSLSKIHANANLAVLRGVEIDEFEQSLQVREPGAGKHAGMTPVGMRERETRKLCLPVCVSLPVCFVSVPCGAKRINYLSIYGNNW